MTSALKTYLINLDRNPERLEHMREVLDGLGLEYERVAAVDGKALSEAEMAAAFNAKRSYIAKRGYRLCASEIGCSLSHLSVYRKMVEGNIPLALIFEDDIKVEDGFKKALVGAMGEIDVSRRQVALFSCYRMKDMEAGFEGLKRVKSMSCSDGYLITLPAAKAILEYNYPVIVPADDWRKFRKRCGVELYKCLPPTVEQLHERFATNAAVNTDSVSGLQKMWLWIEDWFLSKIW